MGFYVQLCNIETGRLGQGSGTAYTYGTSGVTAPQSQTPGVTGGDAAGTLSLEFDNDGVWRQVAPFHPNWQLILPYACGKWKKSIGDEGVLYDETGSAQLMVLRSFGENSGNAFFGLDGVQFQGSALWQRMAKPLPASGNPGMWAGLAGKGGAAAGAGAEAALCYVVPVFSPGSNGFGFFFYAGRLGLNVGASGGAVLVLVTGVQEPMELNGFAQTGTDWALALGGKWSSLAKGLGKLDDLAEIIKAVQKNADAIVGAAKSVYGGAFLDWEEKSVSMVDLVGAGLEAGYYWFAGRCVLLTDRQ